MPLEQPRRDNPLMSRYFAVLGMSGKELSSRAGLSHSQVYMARQRHVGSSNASKIARTVAHGLDLSADEEHRKLREAKPHVAAAAVEASGLSKREIYESARVGKETLRSALYVHCGTYSSENTHSYY